MALVWPNKYLITPADADVIAGSHSRPTDRGTRVGPYQPVLEATPLLLTGLQVTDGST
jgi:hypothetical protein